MNNKSWRRVWANSTRKIKPSEAEMSWLDIAEALGLERNSVNARKVLDIYRGAMKKIRRDRQLTYELRLLMQCRADLRRQMRLSQSPLGTE